MGLLALAALINGAGYAFTLWHDRTAFDEAVHCYTSFAIVAAVGRYAFPRSSSLALIIFGIAIGVGWEIFEWAIGIIGDPYDTMGDLLMDGLGAALAAALWRGIEASQDARAILPNRVA